MLRSAGFIEPCLPTSARSVPSGPQWAYEVKHDGFRFVCWRACDRVRVFSRQGIDWTDRVPLIAEALQALRVKSVIVDGEGVVCRPDGVSDFDLLRAGSRATLASLLRKTGRGVRLSEHLDGADGETVFHHACRMGLEGIVAKRRDRPYRSGRCADWVLCHE
jgi:bifunctional non-homologous end joining protein LigD